MDNKIDKLNMLVFFVGFRRKITERYHYPWLNMNLVLQLIEITGWIW